MTRRTVIKFLLVKVVIALGYSWFCHHTPWVHDDFHYAQTFRGEWWRIPASEIHHYLTWSGRNVAHLIGKLLLAFPGLHEVLTPLAFLVLLWTICRLSRVPAKLYCWTAAAVTATLWLFLPDVELTGFFRIGSANYLWTTMLLMLFCERVMNAPPEKKHLWYLIPLGIAAGWSNEHTGIIAPLWAIGIAMTRRFKVEKYGTALAAALAGAAGYAMLLSAPGNYRRAALEGVTSSPLEFSRLTAGVSNLLKNHLSFAILHLLLLLALFLWFRRKKRDWRNPRLLSGGFWCLATLISSGAGLLYLLPARAWAPVMVFLLTGVLTLLKPYLATRWSKAGMTVLICCALYSLGTYALDYRENFLIFRQRLTQLRAPGKTVTGLPRYHHTRREYFIGKSICDWGNLHGTAYNTVVRDYFHKEKIEIAPPEFPEFHPVSGTSLAVGSVGNAVAVRGCPDTSTCVIYYPLRPDTPRGMVQYAIRRLFPLHGDVTSRLPLRLRYQAVWLQPEGFAALCKELPRRQRKEACYLSIDGKPPFRRIVFPAD